MKKQSPGKSLSGTGMYAAGKRQGMSKSLPAKSSMRDDRKFARGGPVGAHQGGASRGGSRVEPSHQHNMQRKDRGNRK